MWHPEVCVFFGVNRYIFMHVDMELDGYDPLSLCQSNYWTSACFANRAIFARLHILVVNWVVRLVMRIGAGIRKRHWERGNS